MKAINAIKGSIISIAIVLIILIIITPLPSQLLDFLLIFNLSLALIILLITTNITTALQFSIFPSLLLVTTLFRLSLEIQATRLILSNGGNAGQVIKTFGSFVIPKGNVIIGLIIFLIIVIAQFLVITKGSERVAEVAARFTLDAMPGKQMAIDADLNSGLITEDVARKRRSDIQRSADFYGSMDGASKFVKGDAILAIVIMIINIAGGIIFGVMNGGDITSIMSTYTIATVGEGLMAQLPALLISTSTGIIVTRAASEENMSTEVSKQLFSQPLVLRTAGIVLLLMMLINGFPKLILLFIGAAFIVLSFLVDRKQRSKLKPKQQTTQKLNAANSEIERLKNPENVYSMLEVETIEMEFGYSLIPLVEESQGGTFVDKVVLFRRQFALETGVVIPSVRMRDNIQLPNNRYIIKIRGEKVAEGSVLVGSLLIMNPLGDDFLIDGIDTVEPAFGLKARWITQEKRDEAEMDGYTVIEPASVMMTHLSEVIRRHSEELVSRREINSMLDVTKKHNQALVDEVIPAKISVGDLQKILQNLLHENIPIRDTVTILETIADNAPRIKDADVLTEYVRQSLRRTITHKIAPDGELKVLTIDPAVEAKITSSVRSSDHGTYLALDPEVAQNIIDNVSREVDKFNQAGLTPVILVSPAVRMYFKRLTEQALPDLFVVSYNEVENDIKVMAVGAVAA
ncbi:MAG TPA: flagellar biosynthesis protein FlhA [Ruminiclostridium sp.]|nr:flagellar biosynthesis protein FlhA [Ruminiclostridium sp.]